MKFTTKSIEALRLPPDKREAIFWDDTLPGFGVRVRAVSKSWRIQYRVGKQQRSESLGDIRKVTLEDARKIARQRFAEVELGRDPGAQRDAARAAGVARELTLGRVVARYLAAQEASVTAGTLSVSTLRSTQRYLLDYWRPLHGTQIDAIKRAQVAAHLGDFANVHGRMAASAAKKTLSALYSWAAREGLSEGVNPTLNTNDPGAGSRPRDRVLTDDELRIIWKVAVAADDDFSKVLRLCLLTLLRREEAGALRWESEINLETGQLTLPAARTKNRRAHELILPEPALEILRGKTRNEHRPWIFGRHGAGLTGWSYHANRFNRLVTEQ
jgi:integrase